MVIVAGQTVGLFNGTPTNATQNPLDQGYEPFGNGFDLSDQEATAIAEVTATLVVVDGSAAENWGTGLITKMITQHEFYHYQLWVIPSSLQLTNPQLGVNIPFRLWNTWPDPETISSIDVLDSSVITFDIGPGTTLWDGQYRLANLQINPGEPSIDTLIEFNTENMQGVLQVVAAISDTFNLIPDVPVTETWEFLTDILTNYRGQEQRIALRRYPRIRQEFSVEIIDQRQRREQYLLLRKNIVVQSLIAFYQYGTPVNGLTLVGGSKIFFDTSRSNMRVGEFVAAVNTTTEALFLGKINQIDPDGVIVNSPAGFQIDGTRETWIAIPCYNCLIEDGSGITMNSVTGTLEIKATTFSESSLVRPGATTTVGTFDGLPWLNRRPIISADEDFSHRREVFDNETGLRDVSSRDFHPTISGTRKFIIQRVSDPNEMDYWRSLFDTVRGAQGAFLLSTYFPDLTFAAGQLPLADGVSSFIVNEGEAKALLTDYDSWSRFELTYSNGQRTQHKITTSTFNIDNTMTVNFTPAIPAGVIYRSPTMISFLMKVRAQDRVVLKHYANYSEISFGFFTTDV